jgi:hypothetical protein
MSTERTHWCVRVTLSGLIFASSLWAYPARAENVGAEWDRGCSDAKVGSYDRSKHSDAYESGWNACKEKSAAPDHKGKEWDRGCSDAKVGSYDRSKHSKAYEEGWQACKKN